MAQAPSLRALDAFRPFVPASQFVGSAGSRPACPGPSLRRSWPRRVVASCAHVANPTSVLAFVQPALAQAIGLSAFVSE